MANKIDDLFSPERLRRNWRQIEENAKRAIDAKADETDEAEDQNVLKLFERMQCLVKERFAGNDAAALNLFLEELRELLTRMFLDAEKGANAQEEKNDMSPAIHEVLNRIEDLVEAFEIAGRSR